MPHNITCLVDTLCHRTKTVKLYQLWTVLVPCRELLSEELQPDRSASIPILKISLELDLFLFKATSLKKLRQIFARSIRSFEF